MLLRRHECGRRQDVGIDLLGGGRAGDHRCHRRLRQEPTERDVEHAHTALRSELLQLLQGIPRRGFEQMRLQFAQSAACRGVSPGVLAGQQAIGEREERQDADAEPPSGRDQLLLDGSVSKEYSFCAEMNGTRDAAVAVQAASANCHPARFEWPM